MSEYSKTPWKAIGSTIFSADGISVCSNGNSRKSEAGDLRRIAACVNACEGIDTEQLTAYPNVTEYIDDMTEGASSQRDALLLSLTILTNAVKSNDGTDSNKIFQQRALDDATNLIKQIEEAL